MALSVPLSKVKKKIAPKHDETWLINQKFMGLEPDFKEPPTGSQLIRAFTWYSYMSNIKEARSYLVTYLKDLKRPDLIKRVNKVSDNMLPPTACWIARLISRGVKVPVESLEYLDKTVANMVPDVTASDEPTATVKKAIVKPNIQERIAEKASDFIADLEAMVDARTAFVPYDYFTKVGISALICKKAADYYRPLLAELQEVAKTKDEDLKLAYSCHSKKELKVLLDIITAIVHDSDRYTSNVKKTKARAPQKKKVVSAEKKLKTMKYQQEDKALKLSSVAATSIIGAQELWTYNTKQKVLCVYRAKDRAGLDVKGSTILNYDEATSICKRCGRKPEVVIEKILKGGKIILKKIFNEINAEAIPLTSRINISTILLKTVI